MEVSDQKVAEALRVALKEGAQLRQQNQRVLAAQSEPIAIVGMSCRYPGGVRSPRELWGLVVNGVDAIDEFPTDRGWDLEGIFDPDPTHPGTTYVREGGFLYDAPDFDAGFFGIGPREAAVMDPQQRLLLEASWEALEDAGRNPASLRGSQTGVFTGISSIDYGAGLQVALGGVGESEGYVATGVAGSVVSGRIAYVLGLEGPAVTLDTACSSSLVALHWACQALRAGECSTALAGGVTVLALPGLFLGLSRQQGLARDGRCKSFAKEADGAGFAEGVGVLLLERLSDARRNGSRILAVVRGSAVNQDGASNGLSAPNGPSQERVIRKALANASISANDVDAIEAHGTGTKLGDPIEARALLATYGRDRPADRPLWLGSIKSNIGHAQAAAGVAGVIKMVMALQRGVLPRTLHAEQPSAEVDWSSGAVSLLTEEIPWERGESPRRAGVSAFGISGTNVHLILEEAPADDLSGGAMWSVGDDGLAAKGIGVRPGGPLPWILSARGGGALREQAGRLRGYVTDEDVGDVGRSLACRFAFEHRAVVVDSERSGLLDGLDALARGRSAAAVLEGVSPAADRGEAVFLFPGQGSQWTGMAVELLDESPVFAKSLRECGDALQPHLDWSVESVLRGQEGAPGLERIEVLQPVLFAVMVSLAELWRACGVQPTAVVGHSQGEIAAAYVAGGLSLEDAARVVALRSRLLTGLVGQGGIVSVSLPETEVRSRIERWDGAIGLAGVNGPTAVTVSGDEGSLGELLAECEADGVRARLVADTVASHSPRVEVLREELSELLSSIAPRTGQVPFYSTVTGGLLDTAKLDVDYWYRNLREPVLFERVTRLLLEEGHHIFLEASPHPVLCVAVGETAEANSEAHVVAAGTLRREEGGLRRFLVSLSEAWVGGVEVDWSAVFEGSGSALVSLPGYAFQRERYWHQPALGSMDARSIGQSATGHSLLSAAVALADGEGLVFTGRLSLETHPWLADHAVAGTVLLPGTAFLELASRCGRDVGCGVVGELILESPLVMSEHQGVQMQVCVGEPDESGRRSVSIHSRNERPIEELGEEGERWTRHALGVLVPEESEDSAPTAARAAEGLAARLSEMEWPPLEANAFDVEELYDRLAGLGFEYGAAFQGLTSLWTRGDDIYVEVSLPEDQRASAAQFVLHPALLDAALHGVGATVEDSSAPDEDEGGARIPFSWEGACVHLPGASSLKVCLTLTAERAVVLAAVNDAGAPVVTVDSLLTRTISPEALSGAGGGYRDSLLSVEWAALASGASVASGEHDAREWLVLGDEEGELVNGLRALGRSVAVYSDLAELGEAVDSGAQPLAGSVLLDTQSLMTRGADDGWALDGARGVVCEVLKVCQAWLDDRRFAASRLVVLTENALAAQHHEGVAGLTAAGVPGLVRSARAEHPERFMQIDLDGSEPSVRALGEAVAFSDEPQLAVREGELLAPRLVRGGSSRGVLSLPDDVEAWCLETGSRGTFEDLRITPSDAAQRSLSSGEVRLRMHAAGLTFRDVLFALGMRPDDAFMGGEGAGVVIEVGPDVEGLAVGDRVLGLLVRGFGPVAVADHRLLVKIPDGWSFAQGASIPSVFLTAYYALLDLGGLSSGERVLVHAAAGGVGMAAVQIAQHLGAEVFGTANSGKWEALRALGLDDAHIASSRTLDFKDRFLEQTDGAGVDVVLDSLAREFVDASLELMPRGGRFLEMGKTDIRDPAEVAEAHPGVAYQAFDLTEPSTERVREMLEEVMALFEQGALEHLPTTVWDIRHAPDAFRFMSQARHTGKNVLMFPPPTDLRGTVLVTGGTGGLGGLVARHLVLDRGVRSLLLASRRGLDAPGAPELLEDLERAGASVLVMACDVSDRQAVEGLLEAVPLEWPLCGVVHTAGVLEDGVIGSLSEVSVEKVFAPKVDAAWHLHELTEHLDLPLFALFSSAAATMGSPGQGNYAAANSLLDALAAHRRALGLTGVSMAWGYWDQASDMTSGLNEIDLARMTRQGVLPMSPREGVGLFELAQAREDALVVAIHLDMATIRAQGRAGSLPPMLSGLVRVPERRVVGGGTSLARRLAGVAEGEREAVVLDLVRGEVAVVLGHASASVVDPDRAFKDLGFDSLAAVELRNRLNTVTGLRLPSTVVFDYPSANALTRFLLDQLAGSQPSRSVRVASSQRDDEPIAIVGMSCRYPGGVYSPEELWRLVDAGVDAVGGFPTNRGWDLEGLFDPDPDHPGTSYVREGGFLYDAADFDAGFFGISPREALAMDPQQRLLLEASWEALEDAGVDPTGLRGSQTGVFIGISSIDYGTNRSSVPSELEGYLATGIFGSVASGRLAYVLGLEGPAMTVDTACSSSLVALHLACQAMRSGECTSALVGGATVLCKPGAFVELSRQRGLSPDGRCKSFADRADGAGFSDGVGVLLVERLSDALRTGHRVLALVRGSAVNQDGASNGLSAPNGPSQERVVQMALANAGLRAVDVDVVEAHGTGTTLGDPIEAGALLATYGRDRGEGRPLWLGSVKSNIGHTQAAAGVAGVIKMVKAFEHDRLPATLHVDRPSEKVDWSVGEISLLTEPVPWEREEEHPRRAGVSSFGISGTNAHVILEEPPLAVPGPSVEVPAAGGPIGAGGPPGDWPRSGVPVLGGGIVPWVVSGRGVGGLGGQCGRLAEFLNGAGGLAIGDVGVSLAGRSEFDARGVFVGGNRDALVGGLRSVADGVAAGEDLGGARVASGGGVCDVVGASIGRVAFVFPGQGGQWAGMAATLLEESPAFARRLGECGEALSRYVGWSVESVLKGEPGAPSLDLVDVVQPALFAVMVALAGLWRACGVRPSAVVGHSQGEIAAVHVAGGLSLDDAARLVVLRSGVLAGLADEGGMASVALPVEDVLGRLRGLGEGVGVAAVNGPRSVVVSGARQQLQVFVDGCMADGVRARLIGVDYAAHSSRVEDVREELMDGCAGIEPSSGEIPFYSAVTGGVVDMASLDGEYWYRNLREPVLLERATRGLLGNGFRAFIEVSPHPVLSMAIEETVEDALGGNRGDRAVVGGSLRRDEGGLQRFLTSLGDAWVQGIDVDWSGVFAHCDCRRVGLPTYAFQRERYWLDADHGAGDVKHAGLGSVQHPLLGAMIGLAGGEGWVFTGRISLKDTSWLADHMVLGSVLFPGTGFLELVLHAAEQVGCPVVEELTLQAPLVLEDDRPVQLQVTIGAPDERGARTVNVYSRPETLPGTLDDTLSDRGAHEGWTQHATGALTTEKAERGGRGAPEDLQGAWPPAGATPLDVDRAYDRLVALGLEYGPMFQGLRGAWQRGDEVFAEIELPRDDEGRECRYVIHPALFDAALHATVLTDDLEGDGLKDISKRGIRLPFSWGNVCIGAQDATTLRVCITTLTRAPADDQAATAEAEDRGISLIATDESGTIVLSVESLLTRTVSPAQLAPTHTDRQDSLFALRWRQLASVIAAVPSATPVVDNNGGSPNGALAVGQWVLLASDDGTSVAERLRSAGAQAVIYRDPKQLSEALDGHSEPPRTVLLDASGFEPHGDENGEVASDVLKGAPRVVSGVLRMLQAWLAEEKLGDTRLVVLTENAIALDPADEATGLADVGIWGLVRSAQAENPDRIQLIDLDGEETSLTALSRAVELSDEPQLAVRRGELLVPRLERVHVRGKGEGARVGGATELGGGTVVVTGGTGGLGGVVARHLVVEHGVGSLVLASRRGVDAPGAGELTEELEGLGAKVRVVACDVSDRGSVEGLLGEVPSEFPLRGVVHTAGVLEDGVIASLSEESVERVFAAKAGGAWHLHELTRHLDLSMFVLFSSAAATLGSPGQGNYAAANSFLDGLTTYRHSLGLVGTSIAWGYWELTSELTSGLGEADLARMTRQGVLPLSVSDGVGLFDAACVSGEALLVAMRLDGGPLRAQARAGALPGLLRGLVRVPVRRVGVEGSLVRRLAGVADGEREGVVLELVRGEVALVLGHPSSAAVDPDVAFKDLGFDSLAAVELRNRLNTLTGLRLPATLVFDYPTTKALTRYLLDQLATGEGDSVSLDAELDELGRLLAAASADHAERVRIGARLHTLLSALNDSDSASASVDSDEADLQSASDDELFELIDKELEAL